VPRRGNVPKREILPDPMYNSVLVTKLVNSIMLDGKKGVAQKVVYGAFDIIKEKTEKEPLEVFTQAMENIMPSLEVKARRVGGATYGGASCPSSDSGSALADRLLPCSQRAHHGGAPGKRDHGCCQQHRQRREEA
jgi:ribosomal protein S7